MSPPKWATASTTIAAVLAACALCATWWVMRLPAPIPETPAPAVRQADNSLALERRPDPAAVPKQILPPRAKVLRIAQVTVQPDPPPPDAHPPPGSASTPDPSAACPPVTVDLTLIEEPDGAHRVFASSPDGTVTGGIDIPMQPLAPPPAPRRWAAGLSWSAHQQTGGIWAERDLKIPFLPLAARVGVDINQAPAGIDARVRLGMAF
jgi:hypothetical protein